MVCSTGPSKFKRWKLLETIVSLLKIDPKSLPVVGSLVVSIFVPDTLDPGSTPPRRITC